MDSFTESCLVTMGLCLVAIIVATVVEFIRRGRALAERAVSPPRDGSMTFAEFTRANQLRSVEAFKRPVVRASGMAFTLGAGEEVGEILGKVRAYEGFTPRKKVTVEDIGDECADAVHYIDLVAESYGLRLEDCLQRKYNKVSERSGSRYRLHAGLLMDVGKATTCTSS
jgi:NTP pyrophosphatase (non-canonical NTP hydrolase)